MCHCFSSRPCCTSQALKAARSSSNSGSSGWLHQPS
ncbi:cyclic lactone autoinducer peptide [Pseudomonas sp. SWRI51]|nr:cyclic lactone autoinducer peptide [Pseudomonas sp. SWRI51]